MNDSFYSYITREQIKKQPIGSKLEINWKTVELTGHHDEDDYGFRYSLDGQEKIFADVEWNTNLVFVCVDRERLKKDPDYWDVVAPESAECCIDGCFTKWVNGIEYDLCKKGWQEGWPNTSLDEYKNDRLHWEIIERPTKINNIPEIGSEWISINGNVRTVVNVFNQEEKDHPAVIVYKNSKGVFRATTLPEWHVTHTPKKEHLQDVIERYLNSVDHPLAADIVKLVKENK